MTSVVKTWFYLSAGNLLAKKYTSTNSKSRRTEDIILDNIRRSDPKKADALEKRLEESKQVVAQLQIIKSNAAKSRKAAAADKVKYIREQIRILKLMGGDPKKISRQIAVLAKELSAAAREYISTYGTTSQDSAALADTEEINAAGNNVASSNTVESSIADSGTAVSAGTPATTVSGKTSSPQNKDEEGKDASQEQKSAGMTTTGALMIEGSRQYQESQQKKMKDNLQENTAKMNEKSSETEADREFSSEVRRVAAMLKELAKLMKQRLHQAGDHAANQDINQADQALTNVERSISVITGSNMTAISVFA